MDWRCISSHFCLRDEEKSICLELLVSFCYTIGAITCKFNSSIWLKPLSAVIRGKLFTMAEAAIKQINQCICICEKVNSIHFLFPVGVQEHPY